VFIIFTGRRTILINAQARRVLRYAAQAGCIWATRADILGILPGGTSYSFSLEDGFHAAALYLLISVPGNFHPQRIFTKFLVFHNGFLAVKFFNHHAENRQPSGGYFRRRYHDDCGCVCRKVNRLMKRPRIRSRMREWTVRICLFVRNSWMVDNKTGQQSW